MEFGFKCGISVFREVAIQDDITRNRNVIAVGRLVRLMVIDPVGRILITRICVNTTEIVITIYCIATRDFIH